MRITPGLKCETWATRRKRNDTLVRILRDDYGEDFAPEVRSDMQLRTLKDRLGLEPDDSLNDVLRHYGLKK